MSLDSCSTERLSSKELSSRVVAHSGVTCYKDHYFVVLMCSVLFSIHMLGNILFTYLISSFLLLKVDTFFVTYVYLLLFKHMTH
jgi:hypothetical protein